MPRRSALLFSFAIVLFFWPVRRALAQDTEIDHARHIRELLIQEKFSDVAAEFNPQMAKALTAQRLGEVWSRLKDQVGSYQSELGADTAKQQGVSVVLLGCQFERKALNMVVAFDGEGQIAGLQFVPR